MKFIEDIQQFVPSCEQERRDRELFLQVATNNPDCLRRKSKLVHFTSSALVVNEEREKILCCYHKIDDGWTWLGGHVDGNDNFSEVAQTEAKEESNIKKLKQIGNGIFTLQSVPVSPHYRRGTFIPAHVHLDCAYLFVADEKQKLRPRLDENKGVEWLGFDELIRRSEKKLTHRIPFYRKVIDKLERNVVTLQCEKSS